MGKYSGCPEHSAMIDEDIRHFPQYIEIYHNLSEGCQDAMTDEDHDLFLLDKAAEDKWHEEHKKKELRHLENCRHPDCIETMKKWKELEDGS